MRKAMRLFFFILVMVWGSMGFADALTDTVLEMKNFEAELTRILSLPPRDCLLQFNEQHLDKCQLQSYCQKFEGQQDRDLLFKDNDSEIVNTRLYQLYNNQLIPCLKKQIFSQEIQSRIDELIKTQKQIHLAAFKALNEKLKKQIKINNEARDIVTLNQSLLALELSGEAKEESIDKIIKENKLKISRRTIDLLRQIKKMSTMPRFEKESEELEASLFPPLKSSHLFQNLENFIDPKVAGSEKKLLENQNEYKRMAQKVSDTFEEARQSVLAYLRSALNENNKVEMTRAIERVLLVRFKTPLITQNLIDNCKVGNAAYLKTQNSIEFCPQWFKMPKAFLIQTLAHEIGHSIDPCNLLFPLFVKKSSLELTEEPLFSFTLNRPKIHLSEVRCDFPVEKLKGQSGQEGMTYNHYPFANIVTCLHSADSIKAKLPLVEEFKKILDEELEKGTEARISVDESLYLQRFKNSKDVAEEYFSYFRACNMGENRFQVSQMQEAFADYVAAEAFAYYLGNKNESDQKKELESYFLSEISDDGQICHMAKTTQEIMNKLNSWGCKNESNLHQQIQKLDFEPHPDTVDRINRVFLAHPAIRRVLDCGGTKVKYCHD